MANQTQDPAQQAFHAMAIHPDLPGGKAGGRLGMMPEGAVFEAETVRVALPFDRMEVKLGGAANRLIFFSHPDLPDWTFYTSDAAILKHPALAALPELARQAGAIRSRRRSGRLVALGLLLAVAGALAGLVLAKDLLVRAIASQIPYSIEQKIGTAIFEKVKPTFDLIEHAGLDRVLSGLSAPLARAAEGGKYTVRVYIQKSDTVNAYALPGGTIVFTSALLLKAESYDEISGVLAHELAHVTSRHGVRRIIESVGLFTLVQAFFGDATGVIAVLTHQGAQLLSMKYSRDQEREADDRGFEYLVAAGTSPRGMLDFFEKLLRESEKKGTAGLENALGLVSTHPTTQARIDHIRGRLTAAGKLPGPGSAGMPLKKFQQTLRDAL